LLTPETLIWKITSCPARQASRARDRYPIAADANVPAATEVRRDDLKRSDRPSQSLKPDLGDEVVRAVDEGRDANDLLVPAIERQPSGRRRRLRQARRPEHDWGRRPQENVS
jgi:hypothetical protein